jgi:hypothetical protein
MKNRELFTLDPKETNLKNNGVAKISAINEKDDLAVSEYELKTFICEGEYHEGLKKMFESFLGNYSNPVQPAFWVSGFYGSGKSHLVKMASYLWNDFMFPDGRTARNIKPLPQDIQDLLVELDRKQKTDGKLSIAGTLRDFPSKDIRYSFLQIFLNSLGLPQQYHHFKFVHWLKEEGIYDMVHAILEASGKSLKTEVERVFVSTALAKAVLETKPEMADNEANLLELFRHQFARVETISREDFVRTIRNEILPLFFGTRLPCTIIVLDEVQQFIGTDADLAFDVQLLAEDLVSRFDGKFLLVGTGQNALRDTPILQKLKDRYKKHIQLTNTDIQAVIRKTVLDKKPTAVAQLNDRMEAASGEISRNLGGTEFGYLTEDRDTLVADYPLLPSTRKFWYKVLQVVDVGGMSGQLRNQLRLVDESLKNIAEKEIGHVIPADYIFTQTRADLIQAGLLLNDASNLIQGKKAKGGDFELEGRILSAVFLIDQVTSNIRDTGLKSNENTIADLLIDDLNVNSDTFRTKVKGLVKKLVDEKALMPIDDEFKLQTKIGAEWEQEYTKQHIKLNNSGEDQIQALRRERFIGFINEKTKGISVTQGTSKVVRRFAIWDKDTIPNTEQELNLWIRDGWFENVSSVLDEIRAAGINAPLAYCFVKKSRDTELRSEIIKFLASGFAINAMGLPSTPEGEQAKKSMETRQSLAKSAITELIEKICEESIVYLAGGNIVQTGGLKDNIQEALGNIADRQFPDFAAKADYVGWGQALTRALAGNPDSLKSINYNGDVDKHPVAYEILRFLEPTQKSGKAIRDHFMKAPYGWPQDAVDCILVMLKNQQHISSSETDLKVAKISQSVFEKEVHILGAKDKIAIKKLFQEAGITCPPNAEILPYSNEFISKLKTLAAEVGGEAPRPEPFNIDLIKEIENKEGNERLLEILSHKDSLSSMYQDWSRKHSIILEREPLWALLTALVNHAPDDPEMNAIKAQCHAIKDNRLMLHEPDPIQPVLTSITDKLCNVLNRLKEQYNALYDTLMSRLQADEYIKKLHPDLKDRILVKHQLLAKPSIKILDSQGLVNQLKNVSLDAWNTKIAALNSQFQSALEDAVLHAAPQAKTYSLPRKTITNQEEIDNYIAELKSELEKVLKESSSIILK